MKRFKTKREWEGVRVLREEREEVRSGEEREESELTNSNKDFSRLEIGRLSYRPLLLNGDGSVVLEEDDGLRKEGESQLGEKRRWEEKMAGLTF